MKDPFEEFEFKPLTEGLGFHKKTETDRRRDTTARSPLGTKPIHLGGIEIVEDSPLKPPLPREKRPQPTQSDSSTAVDEILKTLRSKKAPMPEIVQTPTVKEEIFEPKVSSLSAMFLDSMLILAGSLLCMIIVLSITKADIASALFGAEPDKAVIFGTIGLFLSVTFIYLVTHRIFLGATPGEWAYDQRLGLPEDLGTFRYAASVVIRTLVVIFSGVITLPILSQIFRLDIAGFLSGTQIYERE